MTEFEFTRLDPLTPPLDVLSAMLDGVIDGDETLLITRDGEPAAVVVSKDTYDELMAALSMQAFR